MTKVRMAGFVRMLNKAMDVRSMDAETLAEESGVDSQKIARWLGHPVQTGDAPTSLELAGLAKALEIPEGDLAGWLSLDSVSFEDQVWLMAAVLTPGLNRDAWDKEATGDHLPEEGMGAGFPGLVDALVPLVMRYGPRVVARVADDLYRQTNEGREEQAGITIAASEERWERRSEAADGRSSGGPRKSKAVQDALKALGF